FERCCHEKRNHGATLQPRHRRKRLLLGWDNILENVFCSYGGYGLETILFACYMIHLYNRLSYFVAFLDSLGSQHLSKSLSFPFGYLICFHSYGPPES